MSGWDSLLANAVPSQTTAPPQREADKDPWAAFLGMGASPQTGGGGDMVAGIREAADALGVDPVDIATAISYETGGTFNPTQAGPTTQWGRHRGLIQFGEPQAEEYGVDWDDPIGSQLGADGAVVKYLKSAGVQPGMGMLDIYSAINAGSVGRYNASDANNGGAPGTVRDKVNNQMSGHRRNALRLLGLEEDVPTRTSAPPQPDYSKLWLSLGEN